MYHFVYFLQKVILHAIISNSLPSKAFIVRLDHLLNLILRLKCFIIFKIFQIHLKFKCFSINRKFGLFCRIYLDSFFLTWSINLSICLLESNTIPNQNVMFFVTFVDYQYSFHVQSFAYIERLYQFWRHWEFRLVEDFRWQFQLDFLNLSIKLDLLSERDSEEFELITQWLKDSLLNLNLCN